MMNNIKSPHAPTSVLSSQKHEVKQPPGITHSKKEVISANSLQQSLRKSVPGSSSGLKNFIPSSKDELAQIQRQDHLQQKTGSSAANRQSFSQNQQFNGNVPAQMNKHEKNNSLSHSQPPNQYNSNQSRALQHQLTVFNNQKSGNSSNAQVIQSFNGQGSQGNIGGVAQPVGTIQGLKFTSNQGVLGVSSQPLQNSSIMNHKLFTLSSNNGLFPKIQNLRTDGAPTIPNSAHSQIGGGMPGPIKTSDASNNVFKNSGGHISGMSNQPGHFKNEMGLRNQTFANGEGQSGYKPLSSPRLSQQTHFHDNKMATDPNLLYQQQLQFKTQALINYNEFKKQNTNLTNHDQSFSPLVGNPSAIQNQIDYQRAKQMSSGSEKRIKMHQQRQYYSEHYRVQQQRQHQQTANAVLKQQTGPVTTATGTSNVPSDKPTQPEQLSQSGRNSQVDQRTSQGYDSYNLKTAAQQQQLASQIYSQQKHKNGSQVGLQALMQNGHLFNGQPTLNNSMVVSNHNQPNVTIQQHQQMTAPLSSQVGLVPNNPPGSSAASYGEQMFFRKRCSSNNLAPNAVSSPPKAQEGHEQLTGVRSPKHSSGPQTQQPTLTSAHAATTQQNDTQQNTIRLSQPTASQPLAQKQENSESAQQQDAANQANSKQVAAQSQTGQTQQPAQPPKIPVICGFHKRILLITCQNQQADLQAGPNGLAGLNPNSGMPLARRIRNKNPNCNHNSNSVFYQPHYNNVKYDDSHKKKEDVLRKVFFKECAKEEEKRIFNGQGSVFGAQAQYTGGHAGIYGANEMARQQAFNQANDPNKHLQIIERILCEYLFVSQPFDRNGKTQLSNTQSLMMELGLDRALTPHRAFLLALIRAGKFTTENMLKVLSEVKTSATEFDNECIYCKYSQYALKESAKLLHKHQQALIEQSQTNPQQALAAQQQIQANGGIIKGPSGEDIRIENLVRMFQSQLFKKSFINTSLMIIQRKMTEKYFQKYHNAKQAAQAAEAGKPPPQVTAAQYGPDGKPLEPKKPAKKQKPKCQQNLSSLEYLAKEIQKLSKNLANPKDKERYLDLKEKYYREFLIKTLKSNGVEKIQFPTATFTPYKYYIGRGNNSGIVRTALKSRFWWSLGEYDDWGDYNFIWTQWKSNRVINCVKTWKEVQELEAKEAGNPDKKRSSQSTRAGGHIDSQLSTQATDKESNSSKENLITTPKKNKLASSTLGNNSSEPQFKRNGTGTNQNSANKRPLGRGKKGDDKDDDQEVNVTSHNLIAYAKQENNFHLSNKKALYYNMRIYFEALGMEYQTQLPLTFHIKEGLSDMQFQKFEHIYADAQGGKPTILDQFPKLGKNLWIVKPGENTNRGCGITVCKDLDQIKGLVQNTNASGNKRSYIIQKYIEKPLLYKNRKFDIRAFTMMCCINGNLQGYWYQEGYLRTSCREFSLKNVNNRYIHLTNDAVQKKLDDYGRFESGNKLSYQEFQKYLDAQKINCDFSKDVVPRLRKMTQHSMRAVSRKLDPHRRAFTFEIYGYDFMLDEDLTPWLIEVNTNPCFELSCPFLARLIPAMVENTLKIAVDPIFPPPPVPASKKHQLPDAMDNKFEMIFNERVDAAELKNLPIDDNMNGIIEEEEMEEEGSDDDEEEQHGQE